MPSEPQTNAIALVLLAHQDDEFALQAMLTQAVRQGLQVHCAYLTHAPDAVTNARRNAESLRVLQALGVQADHVQWAGAKLGIVDGQLVDHLPLCAQWLHALLQRLQPLQIWVPAWEGGHPDHDGLHACAVWAAQHLEQLHRVRQFGLYNAWRRPAPTFRVLTPLPANGPAQSHPMPWAERWRYLRHCLAYPSQWRSWLGLLPPVAWHLLVHGKLYSQGVSPARLQHRPHSGHLYYENRGFADWVKVQSAVQRLMQM